MIEKWKPIPNYENMYEASNLGNIRNIKNLRLLSLKPNKIGYSRILLYDNGDRKSFSVHRLIALTFIENDNPTVKTQINHINGIKNDNRVENLEWCSSLENIRHSYQNGLHQNGFKDKAPNVKWKINIYKDGEFIKTIIGKKEAKEFGLFIGNIYEQIKGNIKQYKGYTFTKEKIK